MLIEIDSEKCNIEQLNQVLVEIVTRESDLDCGMLLGTRVLTYKIVI